MEVIRNFIDWAPLGLPSFLAVITFIVFFHELGHFLVARAFGVTIETFSIGFGRKIVAWRDRKGTEWRIAWIPLGGYVKFLGDENAASMPDPEKVAQLPPDQRGNALQSKPLYQRALIVAAGPAANFLLALVIFTVMFLTYGRLIIPPVIGTVTPGSAAAAAGFKPGDRIRDIDGRAIDSYDDMRAVVTLSAGQELRFDIERGGKPLTLWAAPRLTEVNDPIAGRQRVGILGVQNRVTADNVRRVRYGPIGAVGAAAGEVWNIVDTTFSYLGKIVTGRQDASQISGMVGTANVSKKVAELGLVALINLAALISVSIGLVNLFPIPILDGGHLLYYACEAVLGRPLGARVQDVGFRLGLAAVLGLMVFATWNDLVRLSLF